MQEPVTLPPGPVRFREVGDDDLPLLFALRRDKALQSLLLTVPDAVDDAALHAWIARRRAEPGGLFRMIEDTGTGSAVGFVQVVQVHHRNRTAWLGLSLAEGARGRGLGQATLRRLLDTARHELGLHKAMAEVRVDNFPALRAHLMVGYSVVGTMHAHYRDAAGHAHDVFLLEHMLDRA